jgi:hypothetical protein
MYKYKCIIDQHIETWISCWDARNKSAGDFKINVRDTIFDVINFMNFSTYKICENQVKKYVTNQVSISRGTTKPTVTRGELTVYHLK